MEVYVVYNWPIEDIGLIVDKIFDSKEKAIDYIKDTYGRWLFENNKEEFNRLCNELIDKFNVL